MSRWAQSNQDTQRFLWFNRKQEKDEDAEDELSLHLSVQLPPVLSLIPLTLFPCPWFPFLSLTGSLSPSQTCLSKSFITLSSFDTTKLDSRWETQEYKKCENFPEQQQSLVTVKNNNKWRIGWEQFPESQNSVTLYTEVRGQRQLPSGTFRVARETCSRTLQHVLMSLKVRI